jgi:hypothetical protein
MKQSFALILSIFLFIGNVFAKTNFSGALSSETTWSLAKDNTLNTNTLDACYSFTGDATDESAGTNNGVINGATLTAGKDGVANTAYSFDGISNTINFSSPFLGGTQASEFSYHVRLNVNDISNAPNIWGKTLNWGEVNFLITTNGAILFTWANNVTGNKYSKIQSDNNIINENTWYDIVVVYQNSGAVIYVNGQSVTTNLEWIAQGGSVLSTTQIEASCNFAQDNDSSKIGVRITGGNPGNYFDGIIDEFCIWDSVLTQQEITDLYNDSSLSLDALDFKNSVSIFPNPASNTINITINGDTNYIKSEVYDLLGQRILKTDKKNISIENLSKSTYFLKIYTEKGVDTKKFIKN